MKPNTDKVCPVTGRPLPDGHAIHPVLAVQVRKTASRIPSLYEDALRHIGGESKTMDGTPTGIRHGDRLLWSLLPDLQLIEEDVVDAARLTGMQGPATIITAAEWTATHAPDFTRAHDAARAWHLLRSSAPARHHYRPPTLTPPHHMPSLWGKNLHHHRAHHRPMRPVRGAYQLARRQRGIARTRPIRLDA